MNKERQENREKEIFEQVLDYSSKDEREAFLHSVCGDDSEMLSRISRLLAFHENSQFLPEAPVFAIDEVFKDLANGEQLGDKIGRYKLIELLGEGGCGVVYVADQEEPVRRQVALKVIKPGMDTKSVIARFGAERQALAMMDHPNIAKVLDAGTTTGGRPFFIMELVRGLRITDYCDQNSVSLTARLELFIQVCNAVQHAHQKGIIHRDIKPSNILVTLHDGLPIPKVIDFGIAKAMEGRLTDGTVYTDLRLFIGTPAYMSPEQAEMSGLDIDTRSDIYSLGVLLYELLIGKTPFDAKKLLDLGIDEMRRTLREREPLRPSTRLSTMVEAERTTTAKHRSIEVLKLIHLLRGDLDWIVMKCLEKDRTRRYDTVNGLAVDIRRYLNQEPVSARPPTAAYRIHKFIRRNKRSVTLAGAVVLLLTIAVVGILMGLLRAEQERANAVRSADLERQAKLEAESAHRKAEQTAQDLEANLYINRIALAHRELTDDIRAIHEAEKLLEACKPELRNWEWHYLKRQWLVDPVVLRDPSEKGVGSIALSFDDHYMVSAGGDGFVRIWNLIEQRIIQSLPAHPDGFAHCVAFNPANPEQVVSAGSDNLIKLWNWRNGDLVHSWPSHFSFQWGMAYAVSFSPDGKHIAGSSDFDVVSIWNAASGAEEQRLVGHEGAVFSLTFSPDGGVLATGSTDGIVRIWDTKNGRQVKFLGQKSHPIACLSFCQDGKRLAGASFNGSVQVWDVDSSRRINQFVAHTTHAVGVSFSPDGRRLATAGLDRSVKLWDSSSGAQVLALRDFSKEAQCLRFTRDGNHLVAASLDGTTRIWDATPLTGTEGAGLLTLSLPVEIFGAMDVVQDGVLLATGGGTLPQNEGGTAPIIIWETIGGQKIQTLSGYSGFDFSLAFRQDGRFLLSTGDDTGKERGFSVRVWDMSTQKLAFISEPFPGEGVLFRAAYNPEGDRILAAGHGGKIRVWDAATGRKIGILGEHERQRTIFNLVFSPDGHYLASATQDGNIRVWDGKHLDKLQKHLFEIQASSPDYTDSLEFSPDHRWMVVPRDDHSAAVWDLESRTEVLRLHSQRTHGFRALAFSPDGRWIASGGTDSAVHLWSAETGNLLKTFAGHKGDVMRLRFSSSPEGLRLISGSRDCILKVWDLTAVQNSMDTK